LALCQYTRSMMVLALSDVKADQVLEVAEPR
jgi:hypothetical protein